MEEAPIVPHALLAHFKEGDLIHEIYMHGSYDFTSHPRNYGIHAAELMFVVRSEDLAISWHFNTEWYLPHLRERLKGRLGMADGSGDLGWHYRHQVGYATLANCTYLPGGKCYCTCNYGEARELFNEAVGKPDEIWPRLRQLHKEGIERQKLELSDRARF